ncbi:MAG TPA: hypothetical protein VGU69_07830, partial [Rhizomicrobium sp.]|nr:hypothetical protein [Rhizomicrobium sp.]
MSSTSGFDSTRLCAHKRTHGRIVALALTLLAGTSHAVFAADPPPYVDPGKQGDPTSWVTNEFKANWGLGAINAQNAYSLGITGAGVKVGIFDSALAANPEFAGPNKLTFLETPLGQGAGTGGYTAGYIGANRNGAGAQGIAFGANLFMSSGAALGIAKPTPAGIAAAFAPFVQNGIHIIDNNQAGPVAANLGDLVKQYGAATPWLKSIVDQARDNDLLLITPVGANNFSPGGIFGGGVVASTIPGLIASLPYFNADMLGHAIAVKDLGNVAPVAGFFGIGAVYSMAIPGVPSLDGSSYSNNCAQTRAWCVSAPGSNVPGLTTILDLSQYIDAYNSSKASFWNDFYAVYNKYSQYEAYLNPATKTWLAPIQAGPSTSSAMA